MEVSGQLQDPPALHLGKNPGANWRWRWVCPRAVLDGLEDGEILAPVVIRTLDYSASSLLWYGTGQAKGGGLLSTR